MQKKVTPLLGSLRPADTSDLSAASRAYLLDLTFARHRFGISIMPFVAVPLVWLLSCTQDATLLALWAGFFMAFALSLLALRSSYEYELRTLEAAKFVRKWQPRSEWIALLHGAGLSMAVVLTAGRTTYEFQLFLYVCIATITAANATYQNAALGVFLRFFYSGWMVCTLLCVWAFPKHWPYVLPLSLLFGAAIYRDALAAHQFFVDHVRLEEHSQHLIEQLQVARENAEASLQEKNLFLSTASHDLRQPMHAMSMLVEAIAQRNRDAEMAPLLDDLKSGMGSMNMMFNSLLDLSKLEAGAVAQRAERVSLRPVVRDIMTLFREQASQRGLALRAYFPSVDAVVWADAALLRQALTNLVHNALRYTERGGVLIGLRQRGNTWQLEVWDTGVGIAAEDEEHIFSPYFRNQHAWRLDTAGHGLGLAVVARCARLMDASLGFQSRFHRGSRFWLRLPMPAEIDLTGRPHEESLVRRPLKQLSGCCLVLDDDPLVIAAWKALLNGWGVAGHYASNAEQALQLLDPDFIPNAIFCDQRLRSGESGFEILKLLLDRYPQASGAIVSGELLSAELQAAESEGYLVLRKPLEPAQLHGVISNWVMPSKHQPGTVPPNV